MCSEDKVLSDDKLSCSFNCFTNIANCKKCKSATECSACQEGYQLSENGDSCTINEETCNFNIPNCIKCESSSKCLKCKSGYVTNSNIKCTLNFECPLSCSNCDNTKCKTCQNDLSPDLLGNCQTCIDKYPGCSEDCNEDGCYKYLPGFDPNYKNGNRRNPLSSLTPGLDIRGFGNFDREEHNKVKFRTFLQLKTGFMFYAKISFILYISSGGRVLEQQTVSGTGVQVGKAMGSFSEYSTRKDYLAIFECEAPDTLGTTEIEIDNLVVTECNGETKKIEIPIEHDSKKISSYKSNDIESEFSDSSIVYAFFQSENDSTRRELSDNDVCIVSENKVSLKISGDIYQNVNFNNKNKTFILTTNKGKKAKCTLNKLNQTDSNSYIDCIVENPSKYMSFNSEPEQKMNGGNDYVSFTNSSRTFCKVLQVDGVNSNNKPGKGGSLSRGAIAGVVISCVAVVIVVGFVLFFIKSGKAALIAAENAKGMEINSTNIISNTIATNTSNEMGPYTK